MRFAPVLVVVVEEDVHLAGLLGQFAHARRPLLELGIAVEVLEAVRRDAGLGLPRVHVAAVQAHHGEAAGGGRNGRRAGVEALRLVHAHVVQVELVEQAQGAGGGVVRHPAAAPELHGHAPRAQALAHLGQVVDGGARAREPRRELEQHGAQLAGLGQRRQGLAVLQPEQLEGVRLQVAAVDAALAGGARRRPVAQPGRHALHGRHVPGEQPEGLDVEHEAPRRARHPALRVLQSGRRVVGGVDLDDGEAFCVEAQPCLRAAHAARVEAPAADERGVGPGSSFPPDPAVRVHAALP